MSVTIALVPVVSLCALILLYLVIAGLRSSRTAELRREHERFTQNVVEQDAAIQNSLLGDLLEGRSPSECLAGFERQRAALLPGARLDEAAAWDADELAEFARRRFGDRMAEVNRRLGIAALTATVVIVGACVVLSAVLYNFQPATNIPPAASTSTADVPADAATLPPPDCLSPRQGGDRGPSGTPAPDATCHGGNDTGGSTSDAPDSHRPPSTN